MINLSRSWKTPCLCVCVPACECKAKLIIHVLVEEKQYVMYYFTPVVGVMAGSVPMYPLLPPEMFSWFNPLRLG